MLAGTVFVGTIVFAPRKGRHYPIAYDYLLGKLSNPTTGRMNGFVVSNLPRYISSDGTGSDYRYLVGSQIARFWIGWSYILPLPCCQDIWRHIVRLPFEKLKWITFGRASLYSGTLHGRL